MQDTSEAQWRILGALVGEGTKLVTVGDEQQAIYSFRGGDPANFRTAQRDTFEQGGELLEQVRESIDLLILLTDPADDIAPLAVLKSTYFRWSEQDLYDLAKKRKLGDTLWHTLQVSHDRIAQQAASLLKAWRT